MVKLSQSVLALTSAVNKSSVQLQRCLCDVLHYKPTPPKAKLLLLNLCYGPIRGNDKRNFSFD